jgi:hypothetical protein
MKVASGKNNEMPTACITNAQKRALAIHNYVTSHRKKTTNNNKRTNEQ